MSIARCAARCLVLLSIVPALGAQVPWTTVPKAPFWQNRAIGDLDGDGRDEMVIASGVTETFFAGANPFRLYVLNNRGQPLRGWPVVLNPIAANFAGDHPVLVDFDGDGRLEIVVAELQFGDVGTNRIHAYDRNGHPLPGWPVDLPKTAAQFETLLEVDVVAADLDEDGTPEILATEMNYGLQVTGYFPEAEIHAFRADGTLVPGWPVRFPGVTMRFLPAVGNVLPEPGREVVVGDLDGVVRVLGADGTLLNTIQARGGPASLWRIPNLILANLDADPEQEIIFDDHNYEGLISAVNGDGSGVPGWPVASEGDVFCGIAYGDVTGDGVPELVAATSPQPFVNTSRIHAFSAQGASLPGFPFSVPCYGFDLLFPILGDVSGDGVADILYQTVDENDVDHVSHVRAFQGTSRPIFDLIYPRLPMYGMPTLADFNGNGIVDLVVNTGSASFPDATGSIWVTDLAVPYAPAALAWPKFQLNAANNSSSSLGP